MGSPISSLFGIKYPIIQAGMVWCSGWKLASAVSRAGALGIIGAGSMYPDVLRYHIQQFRIAGERPFAVNVPLLYSNLNALIEVLIEEKVKIVFTSAGNPEVYTSLLQSYGMTVVHVVSSVKFALKAVYAGVDAIVAEGFEAGGHNGRDETSTFCLIPAVRKAVSIPLIAAGGIASGRGMLAAMVLGADGVQLGTRFVASVESSAHPSFKEKVMSLKEGETILTLKDLSPVRLIKNNFYKEIEKAMALCADPESLKTLLGKGRAKAGMFEGDLDNGELEIGQVAVAIEDILPAGEIVRKIWEEYCQAKKELAG